MEGWVGMTGPLSTGGGCIKARRRPWAGKRLETAAEKAKEVNQSLVGESPESRKSTSYQPYLST